MCSSDLWLEATDNLDTAKSAGAVSAHRIRHVTREHGEPDALPTPPPETTTGDAELATWLTTTREKLTRTTPDGASTPDADDFVASYLEHRAAEHEHGPDVEPLGASSDWGPTTGSETSADFW